MRARLRASMTAYSWPGSAPRAVDQPLDEADAIVLVEHAAEPGLHVAAQHERVVAGLAQRVAVLDEGGERHAGELDLLACHFVQFRDVDLYRFLGLLKIVVVDVFVPV